MRNLKDPIGNQTHHLMARTSVPQPTALTHTGNQIQTVRPILKYLYVTYKQHLNVRMYNNCLNEYMGLFIDVFINITI